MIVEGIHVRSFLSHEDSRVEFCDSPLWLIYGENGAGKSALLDAAEYALYGRHRGGKQNASLLVKHGAQRATIEVVIRLGSDRLRVQRTVDARRGNLGGQVARWNELAHEWQAVNVGDGVDAAWDWLKRRLPSHDLFRSGVYLRQGETASFLSGGPSDRIKRFAALIDLGQYTRAATCARDHAEEASGRKRDAQTSLRDLGDLSDEALVAAQARLADAKQTLTVKEQAVADAAETTQGAREWDRLAALQTSLNAQKAALEDLLADADAIRAADHYVRAWDAVAAELASYWQACDDAARLAEESREAARASTEALAKKDQQAAALGKAEERQDQLRRHDLPAARTALTEEESRVRDLRLEVRIAGARARLADAQSRIDQLRGKDIELESWQARERALPVLRTIASAQAELGEALREVEEAEGDLAEAQSGLAAASSAQVEVTARATEAEEAWETLRATEVHLAAEVARLEGQVASHTRLTGEEPECPVCAQPLDGQAHAHVQEVLAEERSQIEALCARRQQVGADVAEAARVLRGWKARMSAAERQVGDAGKLVAGVQQRLTTSKRRVERARLALDNATQTLVRDHPDRTDHLAEIDTAWVDAEEKRVRDGLAAARPGARDLHLAREEEGKAEAALATLRDQRAEGVEPLGDWHDSESLSRRADAAELKVSQAQEEVAKLEDEDETLGKRVQALAAEVARLETHAKVLSDLAVDRANGAEKAERKAKEVRERLAADWAGVLDNRQAYDLICERLPAQRECAGRLTELDQASGQLDLVKSQLKEVASQIDGVPLSHRIPVAQAEGQERQARQAEDEAKVARAQAARDLDDLQQRQRKGEEYRGTIDSAATEVDTYGELSDLLKEGGPVQVWVTEREQQRIVAEANAVLKQLADPLRLVLGQPRRRQGDPALRDVLVVDTGDPFGVSRYFEFLSGGEQFRVALSLALALHRSVSGGAPGTIFVDEGFGALDEHRRDALALQLTDTSQGILRLGLAQSIIICSHSAIVQRHFPYRWLVSKKGGTATVSPRTPDTGSEEDS